jgi:hypothetical protein
VQARLVGVAYFALVQRLKPAHLEAPAVEAIAAEAPTSGPALTT